jgi:hypothetical protein
MVFLVSLLVSFQGLVSHFNVDIPSDRAILKILALPFSMRNKN